MVWLSSRTRYIVYAVEVDKLGYALTQAQPLTAQSRPDVVDRIERYEVASFIRDARSVSSDTQVEQEAVRWRDARLVADDDWRQDGPLFTDYRNKTMTNRQIPLLNLRRIERKITAVGHYTHVRIHHGTFRPR